MKRIIYTFAILFIAQLAFAQQMNPCGTDQIIKEMRAKNPNFDQDHQQFEDAFVKYLKTVDLNTLKANNMVYSKTGQKKYIIPVVFHVLHNNGSENINDKVIRDEMTILNANYNASNPFRSRIRKYFKDIEANAGVEFRLATVRVQTDENGNITSQTPTNGIEHIYVGPLTQKANDNLKVNSWDSQKYLNIWVCNSIKIGSPFPVGGYATIPASGASSSSTQGVILVYGSIGNLGTSNPFNLNTAGHECGHFFGLYHPFQGDSCGLDGDKILDTPPRYFTPGVAPFTVYTQDFSANPDSNACAMDNPDMPDQMENFMDYFTGSYSNLMFTLQQVARMQFALEVYRRNLWQPENLVLTGVDSVSFLTAPKVVPIAAFSISNNQNLTDIRACVNNNITFIDNSYNTLTTCPITSWAWDFGDGANPKTVTGQNPGTITYNSRGYKTVTLTVTNANGSNTKIATNYIYIEGPEDVTSTGTYYADMDWNNDFLQKGWHFENEVPNMSFNGVSVNQWQRNTVASFDGNASYVLSSHFTTNGSNYSLISPPMNFSAASNPYFELNYAFAANYAADGLNPTQDALNILTSTDCGKTWQSRMKIGGSSFESNSIPATNGTNVTINPLSTLAGNAKINSSLEFIPTGASQWAKMTLSGSSIPKVANVKFKILFSCGGGNNLYIDRVIAGLNLGVNEITAADLKMGIHPNPFTYNTTLSYTLPIKAKVDVKVYDIVGKEVGQLFSGTQESGTQEIAFDRAKYNLNSGLYFIKVVIDGTKQFTQKIVIN